jgi:hypothetical protein
MKGIYLTPEGKQSIQSRIDLYNWEKNIDLSDKVYNFVNTSKIKLLQEILNCALPFPNQKSPLLYVNHPDNFLSEAFHILFGRNYKKSWTETDKANEMRSIIKGSTQPCVPFENWVAVVKFLS